MLRDALHADLLNTDGVVLIMLGQSNQQGAAPLSELPGRLRSVANAHIWTGAEFEALNVKANSGYPDAGADWGAEMQVAQRLRWETGKNIYIIKYAVSGSALLSDAGADDWNTGSSGELYDTAVTEIQEALSALDSDGVPYDVLGMDWMQGETDALSSSGTLETDYGSALTSLISSLRTDLSLASLHVTINEIGTTRTGADAVRAAQASVASADSDATLIPQPTGGTTDSIHWNGASQIERGNDIVDTLLAL